MSVAENRLARLAAHLTGFGSRPGFRVAVLGAAGGIGGARVRARFGFGFSTRSNGEPATVA